MYYLPLMRRIRLRFIQLRGLTLQYGLDAHALSIAI